MAEESTLASTDAADLTREGDSQAETNGSRKKKKKGSKLSALKKKLGGGPQELEPDVFAAIQDKVRENEGDETASKVTPEMAADILKQLSLSDYANGKTGLGGKHKKDMADHKFWATQPVPKLGADLRTVEDGAIEDDKTEEAIPKQAYPLPKDYVWSTVDLNEEAQLQELAELLMLHYVEDDDASFRFDYPAPFLKAMQPPGFQPDWLVGVRVASSKKLVAFISGIPMPIRVRSQVKHCAEINFLCVHKKLRGKRLAPVLIKEVTRRCHLKGTFQAVYTGGIFIPTPVARCQYFHRIINTKKLVDVGFTRVAPGGTLGRLMVRNKLPDARSLSGFRELEERDIPKVTALLKRYAARYELSPEWNESDVRHALLSGRGTGESVKGRRADQVVWCYVVEDASSGRITDFASFYTLPSTALKSKPLQIVDAAYLMYYATDVTQGDGKLWHEESASERETLKDRLVALMRDMLITARDAGFDVFNALTLADNTLFIDEHKFGAGDGFLHFYLYNWQVRPIAGGCASDAIQPPSDDNRRIASEQPVISGRVTGSGIGLVML